MSLHYICPDNLNRLELIIVIINFPTKNIFTYYFQYFKKIYKRATVQASYFGRILRLFDFAKTSKVRSNHLFFILEKKNLGLTFWAKKCPDQDLFQKIRACVRYNQKRAKKSSKRAQLWVLPLIFPNSGHLECYTPLNDMCFWSFQLKKKHFVSQKGHCVRLPHAISG